MRRNASYLLKTTSSHVIPLIRPLCFHKWAFIKYCQYSHDCRNKTPRFHETKRFPSQHETWTELITWFAPPQLDHELINILIFFLYLPWLVVRHFNLLPWWSRISELVSTSDYSRVNNAAIKVVSRPVLKRIILNHLLVLVTESAILFKTTRGKEGCKEC